MRFFFYGTLIDPTANAMARRVHERMAVIGPATVAGLIHAVPDPHGWYPVLVPGDGTVRGMLCEARPSFNADDLAALDAYEGVKPEVPAASHYVRREVPTSLGPAQAYLFNQPLPAGAVPICNGDFRAWLRETGHSPFAPPASC